MKSRLYPGTLGILIHRPIKQSVEQRKPPKEHQSDISPENFEFKNDCDSGDHANGRSPKVQVHYVP